MRYLKKKSKRPKIKLNVMKLILNLNFLNLLRKTFNTSKTLYEQAVPLWDEAVKKKPSWKFYILFVPKLKYPSSDYACWSWREQRFNLRHRHPGKQKQTNWETKRGTEYSNFQASFTQCATAHASFQYMKKLVNCKMF